MVEVFAALIWDKDKFIYEAIKIHGIKYDYFKVEYKNSSVKYV